MVTRTAIGKPVTVDISSWLLEDVPDIQISGRASGFLKGESSITINGFWGPEDAICIVCRRGVDTSKEVVATATTDTDPEQYIGIVCRECVFKALEGVK